MIVPVRCVTCHKVLADLWNYYQKRCKELEQELLEQQSQDLSTKHVVEKTVRQRVFEELGLDRICCRRMLLGHVDLIETI
jgi:DNA-directed RNA polymerase subunit N (RpoN/RPB10)